MSAMDFLFDNHVVNGVVPVADAFATSATTDFVNVKDYNRIGFLIHTGDATSGTANGTVTVLASAVAAGTSTTALPFKYRACASSTTVDTWGSLTDSAATGFSMTAADNYMYWVELKVDDIVATVDGKPFIALKVLEVTNDPIVASVSIFLLDRRQPQAIPQTAIA